MALLLNKYPNAFIQEQFNKFFHNVAESLSAQNYDRIRQQIINHPSETKSVIDYEKNIFIHFTYCSSMRTFPGRFIALWRKYFENSPISDITPIIGTRNSPNLQLRLAHTQHHWIKYWIKSCNVSMTLHYRKVEFKQISYAILDYYYLHLTGAVISIYLFKSNQNKKLNNWL